MSLVRVPPQDPGNSRRELAGSTRSIAKKIRGLVTASSSRGIGPAYRTYADDAAVLLEAAADFIEDPSSRPPALKSAHGERLNALEPESDVARKIAGSMVRAMGAPITAAPVPPPEPAAQDAICLRGSSAVTSIPDVIGFLSGIHAEGILWVTAEEETFTIVLERGLLVHASSNHSPPGQRLGDILVAEGVLTTQAFERFLKRFDADRGKIGLALERARLVTREQLLIALEHQVRNVFERILAVRQATFVFLPRASQGPEARVKMEVPNLLLDSARRNDEQNRS